MKEMASRSATEALVAQVYHVNPGKTYLYTVQADRDSGTQCDPLHLVRDMGFSAYIWNIRLGSKSMCSWFAPKGSLTCDCRGPTMCVRPGSIRTLASACYLLQADNMPSLRFGHPCFEIGREGWLCSECAYVVTFQILFTARLLFDPYSTSLC